MKGRTKVWQDPEAVESKKRKKFDRAQSERYAFKTGEIAKRGGRKGRGK